MVLTLFLQSLANLCCDLISFFHQLKDLLLQIRVLCNELWINLCEYRPIAHTFLHTVPALSLFANLL